MRRHRRPSSRRRVLVGSAIRRDSLRTTSSSRRAAARLPRPRCRRGAAVGFVVGGALRALLFVDQRLPVGDRDLIVVGMDFAEGQEAVAIAAVIDEGGLQRRLDARHLRQIDVAA